VIICDPLLHYCICAMEASKSRDAKQRHQQEWLGPGETDRGSRIDSPIPSSKAHSTRFAAYHYGIAEIEAGRDQDLKMKKLLSTSYYRGVPLLYAR
jgi:hypothetical protein